MEREWFDELLRAAQDVVNDGEDRASGIVSVDAETFDRLGAVVKAISDAAYETIVRYQREARRADDNAAAIIREFGR